MAFFPFHADTGRITADSGLFSSDGGSLAGYSPGSPWASGTWVTGSWKQRAWAHSFVVGSPSTRRAHNHRFLFGGF